jgi:flagellar hook assembly protein FlgD
VRIRYALARADAVDLRVIDVSGRVVATLDVGHRAAGYYQATWSGQGGRGQALGAGIYFVRLRVGDREFERKVVLLK